ncbi:hypothetical protein RhiirA1_447636 [Rhizophagus irregularis]|uniref:Uncharacterized protein n=2 Tax=Rhizophagus irregularis TaxID=588596 RepID=A0A2N0SLL1_9GLOM|nr:hypothetical protein RhiirA1_447636 [Rhizophagus irregularis]
MAFLEIYTIYDYIMWQVRKKYHTVIYIIRIIFCLVQKNDKEMLNNSAKIDENSNPNNPASTLDDDNLEDLSPTLIYDPNIDYERLVCDSIYEELKGDPYIEEMMKIIRQQEDYEEDYEES